jgi:hypothetical protein
MSGVYKIKRCINFRGDNLDQWHEFIENQDIFRFPTASHISYTRKSYLRKGKIRNTRRILSAGRTSIKFLTPEGIHLHTTSISKQLRWRIRNSSWQGVQKYSFSCFPSGQLLSSAFMPECHAISYIHIYIYCTRLALRTSYTFRGQFHILPSSGEADEEFTECDSDHLICSWTVMGWKPKYVVERWPVG